MHPQPDAFSPMCPQLFRIRDLREEIAGCMTMLVEPESEMDAHDWAPGQFYMIYVFGHGEVPISVSGDPAKQGELIFTVMSVGSVTRALCAMKPGDAVGLRGPFGRAWPLEELSGQDIIVMAGGLGLAPLRPVLYHMLANRKHYGDISLLYGTRQPSGILFPDELADWKTDATVDVSVTVDNAGREWPGKVGVVTDLLKDREIDAANTSALICGPEVMMRFSAYALLDRGVPADKISVSMERNMKCAVKMCGRCQYGPYFICHDGPVFSFDRVERLFRIREV